MPEVTKPEGKRLAIADPFRFLVSVIAINGAIGLLAVILLLVLVF